MVNPRGTVPRALSQVLDDPAQPAHIRGKDVATGEPTEFWVSRGRISYAKIDGAITLTETGWVMPALVDAHCHVGLGPAGAVPREVAEQQARTDRATGVSLIRDAGSPQDTHWLDDIPDMPRIIRAGRHIARPMRYIRHFGAEVEPENLVDEVRRQVAAGDGWVKLVGDWIDRDLGDLAPLWPEAVARKAIEAAHQLGAKVTAHCFGEESVSQLVNAGIDCIEHGTGLDAATITLMARRDVALVPTLDNIHIFPGIADQAQNRYPTYAKHMRHLYNRAEDVVRDAIEEGVEVFAGTDAGGTRDHGTIMEEIWALSDVWGEEYWDRTHFALGAASWQARRWLGEPQILDDGAPADLLLLDEDPHWNLYALEDSILLYA